MNCCDIEPKDICEFKLKKQMTASWFIQVNKKFTRIESIKVGMMYSVMLLVKNMPQRMHIFLACLNKQICINHNYTTSSQQAYSIKTLRDQLYLYKTG